MNGYTFKGSNCYIFIFASLLNTGQLLKERICSPRSKFFPLRVDHILEGLGRASSSREAEKKSQKLFPFVEMAEKYGGSPIHLRAMYYQ